MNNRGRQRVHTVACYRDTWNKFNNFKQHRNMTADQVLNLLVDSYEQSDDVKRRNYLVGLRDDIQKKINNLDKENL